MAENILDKIQEIFNVDLNNQLKLVSPIPESVNHYLKPRAFIVKIKGKPTAQVSIYETADAKAYKKDFSKYVKEEAKKQCWNLKPNETQHFFIHADYVFPRIDMDANNYWKLILDSITESGAIWKDDNVTCERVNSITYDSKNPHIKLLIKPVDYVGIFEHRDDLKLFLDTYCNKCTRLKNNCSLLHKAIDGKVSDEIIKDGVQGYSAVVVWKCEKFKEAK